MKNNSVWLIGAGRMAYDYYKALSALGVFPNIIGRGERNAEYLSELVGYNVHAGGLSNYLISNPTIPKFVIVAVNILELSAITKELINYGAKKILVEKPLGISSNELIQIKNLQTINDSEVYVAYNRRYYETINLAKDYFWSVSGDKHCYFEFNERISVVSKLNHPEKVKSRWVLSNSSHLIDLVFFLIGIPKKITTKTDAYISWHPSASIFKGNGVSKKNIRFSYFSDWGNDGSWLIKLTNLKYDIELGPLEKITIRLKDKSVFLDYKMDLSSEKHGLRSMLLDFFSSRSSLVNLEEMIELQGIIFKIANY